MTIWKVFKMGIRKSTGFLAVLVVALAVTSIGLLIALLLAKHGTDGEEAHPSNGKQKSETPIGSPTVSKDWDEEESFVTEKFNEVSTVSQKPVHPLDQEPDLQEDPWEKEVRMPKSVIPVHYDIYLFPDLIEGLFSGRVTFVV